MLTGSTALVGPSLRCRTLQRVLNCHDHILFVFPKEFWVFGVQEERGEEERKGEEERRKGGEECGDGVLTFLMVNGRPISGEEARAGWTATCAHDSHVSLTTSLETTTFYGCS